jgi:hypothetical protein
MGIAARQGLGKIRHLDTNTLWVQQAVRCRRLTLRKVLGEENPADVFTKHIVGAEKLGSLMRLFSCKYLPGRAQSAPQLRREQRTKTEMRDGENTEINAVLPHHLDQEALNLHHPQAYIINDDFEGFDDKVMYEQDYLSVYGEKMGVEIMKAAETYGRKRRLPPMAANVTKVDSGDVAKSAGEPHA